MLKLEDYNTGLIYTEVKDCIDCNKCIHGCPILKSNVSVAYDGSYKMCVDERECVLCGTCIDTCIHNVRHYKDDFDGFFWDLKNGKKLSVLIAPAFYLNYPNEYKQLLGYLKSLGVVEFYHVSFGANITTWGYLDYISKHNTTGMIAQPCPSIVRHIEKHLPELLTKLMPIQSPLMCTAIYLKKYKNIKEDLVFLSPCIAKKAEIESKRGLGLVKYNVTFKRLLEHVKREGINLTDYPAIDDDSFDHGMGSLFPSPGGLRENVEYYLGPETAILQIEGEQKSYKYLSYLAENVDKQDEFTPILIDTLNCDRGCSYGTGTEFRSSDIYTASHQAIAMRKKRYTQNQKTLADLNESFKNLNIEDFKCEYEIDSNPHTQHVSEAEIEAIFNEKLMKLTDNDQHVDCTACGYRTCHEMAEAIAYGINHQNNCIYFVKNTLAQSLEEINIAEERLSTIIDCMPLGCVTLNANYEIIGCNEEILELFKLPDMAEFKDKFFELSPPLQPDGMASLEKFRAMNKRARQIGRVRFEWTHQKLDETPMPCEITLISVNLQGTKGILAFIRDMREFVKFKENRRLMEQRLKAMLDASPILCAIYDESYKVIEANQAAATLFGLEDKKVYIERFLELCPEFQPDGTPTSEKVPQVLRRAFKKGRSNFEWMHQDINGVPIPCEVYLKRVDLDDKAVVIAYARDLREQNNMIENLEAAKIAKGKFLSNMSHEIRTPMNAIIGMTNIALNSGEIYKKDDCLEKISNASSHLLGVINQILDMSKIEADKLELDLHPFNFELMVSEVTSIIGVFTQEKNQSLVVTLDSDIPRYIVADKLRLAQVITNILTNAVKFTPENGIVSLRAKSNNDVLHIEIEDTGIGIAEENKLSVFDDFEQAEAGTTRKFGGTGLGLAISKRIVETMGGKIDFESQVDKGTKFTFSIPFEVTDYVEENIAETAQEAIEDGCYSGHSILIAEDVDINREIVEAILEPTGAELVFAEDGEKALQIFSADPDRFSLVFMDVHMPNMDGLSATSRIRDIGTKKALTVPIIAMTANVFHDDIRACLNAGMNDHLAKPLDVDLIMKKLKKYMPRKTN